MKSSINIPAVKSTELDTAYVVSNRGVYIPSIVTNARVINTGSIVLYVTTGTVDLFNPTAWGKGRFTLAPSDDLVTMTFANDAPVVSVASKGKSSRRKTAYDKLCEKSPAVSIPCGSSVRKTIQIKLYNCFVSNLKYFNSNDGVTMEAIRNTSSGGTIAYIVKFGRNNSRGTAYVYSDSRIAVESDIPGFNATFTSVETAIARINSFVISNR